MYLKWFWIFLFSGLFLHSCKTTSSTSNSSSNEIKLNKELPREINKLYQLSSGIQITLTNLGEGSKIKTGDEVFFHYIGRLAEGKVFDNSHDRYKPVQIKMGNGMIIKGLEEAFKFLYKGDKALVVVPPNLGYGNKDLGIIPPNSTLSFEIEIVELRPFKEYIYQPISGDTVKTSSGLRYIVLKEGNGNLTKPKQKAELHYAGFLWDGKKFDSSYDKGIPYSFTVGTGEVIAAWDQALLLMNKGSKLRILVPSQLGYGEQGSPPEIPRNARLIFDIELLDISN
jgi:peptidylprolyl isomerase